MSAAHVTFPLSALVGQEALVEALLVNAVAPDVGGVLVRGERGTAKSTAVRALAPLLPPVHAAAEQAFAFAPGELAPHGPVPHDAVLEARPAPLVELPLGATLDRLVGALDLGRALAGEQAFEAGLLARAHRGILYVDEVNLLPDHLVDALLDAAASGVARVEREAVSASHAARFLLVGTMNVEEGELRPQLLDRFGLGVEVRAPRDRVVRAEIVRRRLAFERDPSAFAARFASEEDTLRERIAGARALVASVRLPERELLRITGACAELEIDGVRGDIVCARAAQALAALDGASEVEESHVRRAAALALAHRRHRDPLGSGGGAHDGSDEELQRALDGEPGDGEFDPADPDDSSPPDGSGPNGAGGSGSGSSSGPNGAGEGSGGPGSNGAGGTSSGEGGADGGQASPASAAGTTPPDAASEPPVDTAPDAALSDRPADDAPGAAGPVSITARARERRDPPAAAHLPLAALVLDGAGSGPAGRRARGRGIGVGAIDSRAAGPESEDLAVVASLRARLVAGASPELVSARAPTAAEAGASPMTADLTPVSGVKPALMPRDAEAGARAGGAIPLHEHVRAGRESVLLCLVVDASGSMGARQRLARVKGALLGLLRDAYARRDRVAVIAFRDARAELLVRPGAPLEQAGAAIRALPTGGRTPLAEGLREAAALIGREAVRDPHRRAVAVVLTDGRVQDPHGAVPAAARALGRAAGAVHVVDTEEGHVRLGLAGRVAVAAGGQLHRLAPGPAGGRDARASAGSGPAGGRDARASARSLTPVTSIRRSAA